MSLAVLTVRQEVLKSFLGRRLVLDVQILTVGSLLCSPLGSVGGWSSRPLPAGALHSAEDSAQYGLLPAVQENLWRPRMPVLRWDDATFLLFFPLSLFFTLTLGTCSAPTGKLFLYKVHYNIHVRTHTKEHLHYCSKCSYSSITKSSLKRHQIQKHSGLLLSCSHQGCSYTTADKYKLQAHARIHRDQVSPQRVRSFKGPVCTSFREAHMAMCFTIKLLWGGLLKNSGARWLHTRRITPLF